MKTQTVLVLGALLLVACGGQPVPEEMPPTEEDVPELTLNLPANGDCDCGPVQENFTFLEKGFNALVNAPTSTPCSTSRATSASRVPSRRISKPGSPLPT